MKIAIGTLNPAKIKAVTSSLDFIKAEILPIDVPSGVSNQPFSDEETILGAVNRATRAFIETNSNLGIGLEGGVIETKYGMFLCNWGALVFSDEQPILAGGARILLPEDIASRLKDGEELGIIMDSYTKKNDVRKNEGAVGIFTNGHVNRADMFTHIVKLLIGQYFHYYNAV